MFFSGNPPGWFSAQNTSRPYCFLLGLSSVWAGVRRSKNTSRESARQLRRRGGRRLRKASTTSPRLTCPCRGAPAVSSSSACQRTPRSIGTNWRGASPTCAWGRPAKRDGWKTRSLPGVCRGMGRRNKLTNPRANRRPSPLCRKRSNPRRNQSKRQSHRRHQRPRRRSRRRRKRWNRRHPHHTHRRARLRRVPSLRRSSIPISDRQPPS